MSSVRASTRQISANGGYFIPIGDCRGKILAYNGAGAFSVAQWASVGYTPVGVVSSLNVSGAAGGGGALMRDMGTTVVSSARTFRKVQLVVSTLSTFGVSGAQGTSPNVDYYTGYIELGFEGAGVPTPVAQFGR